MRIPSPPKNPVLKSILAALALFFSLSAASFVGNTWFAMNPPTFAQLTKWEQVRPTGSMMPSIDSSDYFVIDYEEEPRPGDIVKIQRGTGDNEHNVLHRIVMEINCSEYDGVWYVTKGDANVYPDQELVSKQDIKGVVTEVKLG